MKGTSLRVVVSGDSAGANIGAALVIKVLEMPESIRLPLPEALVWAYPALNFNYESWMDAKALAVLHQESSGGSTTSSLRQQKDHLSHRSPLSIVDDRPTRRRTISWSRSFAKLSGLGGSLSVPTTPGASSVSSEPRIPDSSRSTPLPSIALPEFTDSPEKHSRLDDEDDDDDDDDLSEDEKPIRSRVRYWHADQEDTPGESNRTLTAKTPRQIETRLTMTSRSACFNDRILSAPMMRSMVSRLL